MFVCVCVSRKKSKKICILHTHTQITPAGTSCNTITLTFVFFLYLKVKTQIKTLGKVSEFNLLSGCFLMFLHFFPDFIHLIFRHHIHIETLNWKALNLPTQLFWYRFIKKIKSINNVAQSCYGFCVYQVDIAAFEQIRKYEKKANKNFLEGNFVNVD